MENTSTIVSKTTVGSSDTGSWEWKGVELGHYSRNSGNERGWEELPRRVLVLSHFANGEVRCFENPKSFAPQFSFSSSVDHDLCWTTSHMWMQKYLTFLVTYLKTAIKEYGRGFKTCIRYWLIENHIFYSVSRMVRRAWITATVLRDGLDVGYFLWAVLSTSACILRVLFCSDLPLVMCSALPMRLPSPQTFTLPLSCYSLDLQVFPSRLEDAV
jgi:hypothetical protein